MDRDHASSIWAMAKFELALTERDCAVPNLLELDSVAPDSNRFIHCALVWTRPDELDIDFYEQPCQVQHGYGRVGDIVANEPQWHFIRETQFEDNDFAAVDE
ncbi:hypothetical protein RJ55_06119 [Drechmeria coniospora]|nr:hypothetical protein RJ55_06119 [Drechmeria coniospora]